MWSCILNLLEAQKIINDLSEYFEIYPPSVRWKRRKNPLDTRSWYYASKHVISLDLTANHGTVLHEFAHALQDARGDNQGHGHSFRQALLDVVVYYYDGNIDRYPWKWDYKSIYNWYKKYGQTTHKKS